VYCYCTRILVNRRYTIGIAFHYEPLPFDGAQLVILKLRHGMEVNG
jgi:hypothetical protein